TMPPAPDWQTTDGVLAPVWRWYRDYGRYLRIARRFLGREADWGYYCFLLSDSELASAGEAVRHRIPTALILDATRHDFARDPLSRFVEGPANFWASRIARKAELVLAAESAPDWPNVRRIGPIVRGFSASREKLREDFVFRKKTILVTVGGTAVGEFLIREAVRAFHALKLEDVSMVVVSGPKLKVDSESGVYTYGFLPNLQDYVLAADLVITTAGKGTVNEALAAGTPVIAIPPEGRRRPPSPGGRGPSTHACRVGFLRRGRLRSVPGPPRRPRATRRGSPGSNRVVGRRGSIRRSPRFRGRPRGPHLPPS